LRSTLSGPALPGGLEEGHEPWIVERQDRFEAVLGGSFDRESVVGLQILQDRFGTVRHVGRRPLNTRLHGIGRDQPQVLRAVDDLHDDGGLAGLDTVGSLRCDARALEGMRWVVRHWNLDRPDPRPPQQQGGR